MTDLTKEEMITLVTARAAGRIRGTVRLEMPDLCTLFVDETGAVESDAETDLTLTAKAQVFHDIAPGKQNPGTAFMTRKPKVDGSPMRALKVGEILSTE